MKEQVEGKESLMRLPIATLKEIEDGQGALSRQGGGGAVRVVPRPPRHKLPAWPAAM